ncbi:MAG: putative N-acetyltransferase YhbS [Planctomycetota bacterium]|jgi:predicted N-acetyltransferase YhbS
MNLNYRQITDIDEARSLAKDLQPIAEDMLSELRDVEVSEEQLIARINASFESPECLLVVVDNDEGRVGYALTLPFEDPLTAERVPMLVLLGVSHTVRNRGIARGLVQTTLNLLAQRGIQALAARAAHNDDALISMGERWGFVRGWEWMIRE